MANQPHLSDPALYCMRISGSFEITPDNAAKMDDEAVMFVVVGHLVGENRTLRASGDVKWDGRLAVDDAVQVVDPKLRSQLFEQLGLIGVQGNLDDELDNQLDMGEPAVSTPAAAAPEPEKKQEVPPAPLPKPNPPPAPSPTRGDPALHAFLYGGE